MPTSFGEAKEVGRLPGRTPGLVMMLGHAYWVIRRDDVTAKQQLLLKLKVLFNEHVKDNNDGAARALPGDATRLHCRGDKPGIRPGGRVTFFASPKKVTKKGDPVIAPRCAGCPCQRYPERGAAKLAALRSDRRRTFSRSGHR